MMMLKDGNRDNFKDACVERLMEEVDSLIYFGMNSKGLSSPRSPKQSKFSSKPW